MDHGFYSLPGDLSLWEVAVRLVVALMLGGIIGLDRQIKAKPLGLRSYMLVAMGSAAYTLLVFQMMTVATAESDNVRLDPTRLIEGLIGGIGFLGAGAIISSRRDRAGNILGGATGASIWVSGAIGIACGMGSYLIAIAIVVAALVVLFLAELIEMMLGFREGLVEKPEDKTDD